MNRSRCLPGGSCPESEIGVLERWVRMGAPDPRTDPAPDRPSRDRSRRGPLALGVPTDRRTARAASEGRGLAAHRRRSIHPRQARVGGAAPGRRRRQADAAAASLLRPDRPPADAGRDRVVPRGRRPRRVREGRRCAAGPPRIRRALGPPLARRRPLCRLQRLGRELHLLRRLALSQLRDRRVQRRQAVRPVPHRAAGRRPAPLPHPGGAGRQHRGDRVPRRRAQGDRRDRQEAAAGRCDRRAARHDRQGLPRVDDRLRGVTTTSSTRSPPATTTPWRASWRAPRRSTATCSIGAISRAGTCIRSDRAARPPTMPSWRTRRPSTAW